MALKNWDELRKIDVTEHCEMRDVRDDKGNKIQVAYLPWAKCVDLLHAYGAEKVYFEPLIGTDGSTLFMSEDTFVNEKGQKNRCYEVRVKIVIDDLEFVQNYPLLNGVYVVREDTINQLRVSNAQKRAFVKGVALRTGLGFGLWADHGSEGDDAEEDLTLHSILKIKERIERLITEKMDKGLTLPVICEKLNINEDQLQVYLKHYTILNRLEKAIEKI